MKIHDDSVSINEALLQGYGWTESQLTEHARTQVPKADAKGTSMVPAYYTSTSSGKVMYRFACKQVALQDGDGIEAIRQTALALGKDEAWAADAFCKGANLLLGAEVKPQPPTKRGGVKVSDQMGKLLAAIASGNETAKTAITTGLASGKTMEQIAAAFAAE